MLDPRANTTIAALAEALARCGSFAITGHVNPDGDCLGSALALAAALRKLGKQADVLLVEDSPIEPGLRFLPGIDAAMPAERYEGEPEAFVAVDVSVAQRIGRSADVLARVRRSFVIDHHASPDLEVDYLYDDPDAASCSMLVWEVAKALGAVSTDVAQCAYVGLMTDTGRFQYQNTDERAFAAAAEMVAAGASPSTASREFYQNRNVASLLLEQRLVSHMELLYGGQCVISHLTLADFAECGAEKSDAESLIDTLRSVRGARVACILKEREGFVRGSFRAKDDDTDVAALARGLGGGGHKAAAGFTLEVPLAEAISAVKAQLATVFEG